MIQPWTVSRTKIEAKNRIFNLITNTCLSPRTGMEHDFLVLEAGAWVNVIPLTPEGDVLFVRQYRHAARETTLEIPGGLVENGQSPLEAARRELLEETGHACPNLIQLGRVRPNPAILDNYCYLFLAEGVTKVGEKMLDATEDIEVVSIPLLKVPEMIMHGRIDHALVIAAFFYYFTGPGA